LKCHGDLGVEITHLLLLQGKDFGLWLRCRGDKSLISLLK
jgi:hypothetical protein